MEKVTILKTCPSFHILCLSDFKFYTYIWHRFQKLTFILKEILLGIIPLFHYLFLLHIFIS
jgi:hypothetical protein